MSDPSMQGLAPMRFVNETPGLNGGGMSNGQGSFVEMGAPNVMGKRTAADAGFGVGGESDEDSDTSDLSQHQQHVQMGDPAVPGLKPGKKTKGRVKIKMEFIENKLRRYTTFSKRKTGIMKKAYELSTLTGTQVMLLVASETGHVYTFATRKLQPMITSESGKALIQTCLNSPDPNPLGAGHHIDQRMNPTGFEEPELSYAVGEDDPSQGLEGIGKPGLYSSPTMVPVNHPSVMEASPPGRSTPNPPLMAALQQQSHMSQAAQLINVEPQPPPAHSKPQQQQLAQPPQAHATPPQSSMPPPPHPEPSSTPQRQQTVAMTYLTAPTTTSSSSSSSNKPQNLSMQLPGGIATAFIPQTGLPPGTPIAISPMPQGQGGQAQQVFRLPAQGQVIQVPVSIPASSTENSSSGTTSTAAASHTTTSNVSGSPGGTIMYQTPQGVVYAAASASTLGAIPEYIVNLAQQPAFAVSPDQPGGAPAQQYITIPVPVSLASNPNVTQLLQPVIAQGGGGDGPREGEKIRK